MVPLPISKKLRVGLVGYGYWGQNMLRNLTSHRGFEVVGVVDSSPPALETCSIHFPYIKTFGDLAQMFSVAKPEVMVICAPPAAHCNLAIECMNRGSHVLVEKPLARSVEECNRILDVAKKLSRKVMVDHTFLYHPAIEYIGAEVFNGSLGIPLYYDSIRVNFGGFQRQVNVLWDLAPHDLSILDFIVRGVMPISVFAVGKKFLSHDVESLCHVTLNYPNDFIAHIHLNWIAPVKVRSITLGGSLRMLIYDENLPTEKIKVYDRGITGPNTDSLNDARVKYLLGGMISPALPNREALGGLIADLYSHVAYDKPTISDGECGKRVVQLLEMATHSMATGQTVKPDAVESIFTKEKNRAA